MPHNLFYRAHFTLLTRTFLPTAGAIIAPRETVHQADVVRRTIPGAALPEWPGKVDHFTLERVARAARRDYLREALPRWIGAVGSFFSAGSLRRLADGFWNALENAERARRDAWLAQSTDVCDLEQRIRSLERQAVRGTW